MLLAGDTDAEDRLPVDIGREQGAAGGEGEGVEPLSGALLAATIGAADHRVRGGAFAEHLTAGRIEDDRLGALGAAVDAEEELSGGHSEVLRVSGESR